MNNKSFTIYKERICYGDVTNKEIEMFYSHLTDKQRDNILQTLVKIIREETKNGSKNKKSKTNR